ncbi:unnamed protein product, partial [marine sediment metagenome]
LSSEKLEMMDVEKWYEEQVAAANALYLDSEDLIAALALVDDAYKRQKDTIINDFLDPIEDIIAKHTLSDYEFEMRSLNEWYEEQMKTAHELGLETERITLAYEYQVDALEDVDEALGEATKSYHDLAISMRAYTKEMLRMDWGVREYTEEFHRLAAEYRGLDIHAEDYYERSTGLLSNVFDVLQQLVELQQETVQELRDTAKSIETAISELTISELAPVQSAEAMMTRYARLLQAVFDAPADEMAAAATEFTEFASGPYLEFMKVYAPSEYKELFASVLDNLQSVAGLLVDVADEMAIEIDWTTIYDNLGAVLSSSIDELKVALEVALGSIAGGLGIPGYQAGGIATGPSSGYMAQLHGTEAVIPLSGGKTIPVEIMNQEEKSPSEIHVHVKIDSREIGYVVANEFKSNTEL